MREPLLKNVCHEIKDIISLKINIKSFCIALYLFITAFICYVIKLICSFILPDDYKNPADIFSTILDRHSLYLYCAIAGAAMMVSLLLKIIKAPDFIRLDISESDVILPVLSIFYMLLISSIICSIFGKFSYRYIINFVVIIFVVNLLIVIYRYLELIGKALSKHCQNCIIIFLLIFSIITVIVFLQDVNLSN